VLVSVRGSTPHEVHEAEPIGPMSGAGHLAPQAPQPSEHKGKPVKT
jgi:hypothetical protein